MSLPCYIGDDNFTHRDVLCMPAVDRSIHKGLLYRWNMEQHAFFFCIYDILTTQALPRLSLFHDALRDKKYLIGKKLQEYKKD